MDKIPPEIMYLVCSLLNVDDILHFRLVNKLFADIGAAYMLPEVTFYLHQEELDRLEAISLHPIFSKHVSSLTYFAEALDSPKVSWREFVRDHKKAMRWNGTLRKQSLTPAQLMAEYNKYLKAVDDQDELMEKKKDMVLLKQVLPRFPKLETLTMSAGKIFYEGNYRIERKRPLTDCLRWDYMCGVHPEGQYQLDTLLLANVDSQSALTTLRAGSLHWRFFKRSERELAHMFKPLANLTSIQLTISVDPADERVHEGNSLRKCQRVMAKGTLRRVLKSMPQLESLYVEILNLDCNDQEKGAYLRDIIEPGFRWPNLKSLVLGGIVSNRVELMNVFRLHKNTLRKLCLRDMTLASTSWRKLLPQIRETLYLEDACICGDIYGQSEEDDEDDEDGPWNTVAAPGFEYWDLSVPEVGAHNMRQSINMYCRRGGEKYPDILPLCEFVTDRYYEQYVLPFFEDHGTGYGGDDADPDSLEWENDGAWEDVTDEEESDGELGDASAGSLAQQETHFAFQMMLANSLVDTYYDGDEIDEAFMEEEIMDELDVPDFNMESIPAIGLPAQSVIDSDDDDDDMPGLI
ncbi:putative F-box protein [Rosellinia necatrix]|uniref:Putative F-box protein n=1 Tax=Rosellinia necatrix TaxID=77044 RepID=A0A1W2TU57_ROSNE|nr:putative F-box protein [Rosellinia necatrix]